MPTYRYQPGDRPLDGYTVRAAAGRGGFGEVYFAQSDAGREVALKALYGARGYDQIELRGVQHCMNLKSPHLVSIFDVKTGDDGTAFVIMEYVAGPSLRDLLNDAPQGLGPDKAAFFLREVAKGLSHLHGYGVVHRDLKPANIFYEDGYVKIGDYGLSKLMSADAAASQTVTVGTVHYMAPEIGAGKYDKSIDLYALGCLLYEMLTGRVPYSGASPSEVLMKHLQAEPELDDVPEHFAHVIRKALQKDPDDRYATAAEMVEDLFGEEHVRNSVSHLSADELSHYAARAGRKLDASPTSTPTPRSAPLPTPAPVSGPADEPFGHPARRPNLNFVVDYFERSLADPADVARRWPARPGGWFIAIAAGLALATTLVAPRLGNGTHDGPFSLFVYLFVCGGVAAWNLSRSRSNRVPPSVSGQIRAALRPVLRTAVVAVPLLFLIAKSSGSAALVDALVRSTLILGGCILAIHWPPYLRPTRERPLNLALWLGAGLAGATAAMAVGTPPLFVFTLAVTAALGAQLLSPPAEAAPDPAGTPPPGRAFTASTAPTLATPELGPAPTPAGLHAAAAAPSTDTPSRHSRLAALLLCAAFCVFPLGGLHRFYTGRWITGTLWLCTFGLLGVGQLIDGILIAAGAFTDRRGRPVTRWRLTPDTPRDPASGAHRTWTPAIDGRPSPLAIGTHLVGVLVLLGGLAMLLPVWFSLPDLIGTLPAFAEMRQGVGLELGYDAWPRLMGRGLLALGFVALVTGTVLIAFARRGGVLHLLRALAGGAVLCFCASLMATEGRFRAIDLPVVEGALRRIPDADRLNPLANLDVMLGEAVGPNLFAGLVWLALAVTLFAIPARPPRSAPAPMEPPR